MGPAYRHAERVPTSAHAQLKPEGRGRPARDLGQSGRVAPSRAPSSTEPDLPPQWAVAPTAKDQPKYLLTVSRSTAAHHPRPVVERLARRHTRGGQSPLMVNQFVSGDG
jgi:hypothetical protein